MKILESQPRFHQLEIPGMEELLGNLEMQPETTKTNPKPISEISANNTEIYTPFHQLEVPGMEECLSKLKTQSETTDLSEYGDAIAISIDNLADETAA
ncbi:hypothetical protein NDI49_12105 [Trichocoleus sp. ST-U3]|uniref:hypothetical protein n=2 Tax=Cyanophyceae TaxID=3028117 RepID=UPI00168899EC|nr:hypothetical protein [Coleofasciculus sp. FACHB-542]MBD2084323.1 hypothetical protein [Coleofasciculus sp. FACHB-542]